MPETELILTKHIKSTPNLYQLAQYKSVGGYHAAKKALDEMQPPQIIDEIKKATLRGRGGAGFPAGTKWGFVPMNIPKPRYLCINADEGEPGTFKDKIIMEDNPHMLIEGIIITCYAMQIHHAYIYIRGEFVKSAKRQQAAIDEAYKEGILGDKVMGKDFKLDITVQRGAGAYICGEETGLIESLEGKPGKPRIKPPFPAVVGVFGSPTVVNNVETIALVPPIIEKGLEWWNKMGSEKNPGTRLYSISGHVNKPGVYELPMGIPIRELIYEHGGGIPGGRKFKGATPGGVSAPVLTEAELDTKADFDSLMKIGSMAGSGGIIVYDERVCMVRLATRIARFFAHESCGQCTPCREGTDWVFKVITRIEKGQATSADIDKAMSICKNMMGLTICVLSDAAAMPLLSLMTKYRSEFEQHVSGKGCPFPASMQGAS
jgi:NADH-quinone oxidoreductase subunit F